MLLVVDPAELALATGIVQLYVPPTTPGLDTVYTSVEGGHTVKLPLS